MPKKALKYIFIKNKESLALLESIAVFQNLRFAISQDDKYIYGTPYDKFIHEHPIIIDGQSVASLHTSGNAKLLLQCIHHLMNREIAKKTIAGEVLNLYREINMIYNFSEQLSQKIEVQKIAQTSLEEAFQILPGNAGAIFLKNEFLNKIELHTSIGVPMIAKSGVDHLQINLQRLLAGNAEIIDKKRIKEIPAISFLNGLMVAPLKVNNHCLGVIMLGDSQTREYKASQLKLLTTIAQQSAAALETAYLFEKNIKEVQAREEAIKEINVLTNRFVPHAFIKSLGKANLTEVQLGDLVEREVTVLFADIRGYAGLSEKMTPEDNFKFVCAFNKRMGPIIRENNGFINQYLGDGFMAIFPEDPQNALEASILMHRTLADYNYDRIQKKRKPIQIGIGMQSGPLIMGITGDEVRLEAATISDTVNTAARIESLSKHYGASILLTEDSVDRIPNRDLFHFRFLGSVQVKGREMPIQILECIDGDAPKLFEHKRNTLNQFNKGMELYLNKEFALAAVSFESVLKAHRQDRPAKLFLQKAAKMITQEVTDDWNGIEVMQNK